MPIKYYVLPEERKQMQEDAVKRAMVSIKGPVSFYEQWPGEGPTLTITDEARQFWRRFCNLVCKDKKLEKQCRLDYEERVAACQEPQISLCWLGIHNAVCPIEDENGGRVTLIGGKFRVRERMTEAKEQLEQFLETVPPEQQEMFYKAWQQIPEVSEAEVLGHKMRKLELTGRSYLYALKQRSDLRYSADLVTHDVVGILQALIADIEVLKIELKDAFNIGRKWEARFEELLHRCEEHDKCLEAKLNSSKPQYAYDSINKLIHECVGIYLPKAEAQGIEFRVDLEQMVDEEGKHKVLAVRMDRVNLRQALQNVLDNAVKYSFSGTASHPRWIDIVGRLETAQGIPGYLIVVSNLGIGIEKDELALVFEPGYQGRRRLDEARSGYGMGLTFVKECVRKHGGSVIIRSQPQQRTGWLTTLSIWLPLQGPTA